jgi:hypothetical protein
MLPDELIEWQMLADVVEPPLALLQVSVYTEVGGLPFAVLAVCHTADGFVECLASESAAYLDRLTHRNAQRFQHISRKVHQVDGLLYVRLIIDAFYLCSSRGAKFIYGEVHSYLVVHWSSS